MMSGMQVRLGMTLMALRRTRGWSQAQLAERLGISQQRMSRLEADVHRTPLALLERWSGALGGYLAVEVRISGQRALTDARHAALQNRVASALRADVWAVETEVSFNHFGDRGRIDVLAFHTVTRILLVVEIKTRIVDMQDLFGRLDVKKRIAPNLARDRGWHPVAVVPALILREDRTSRRRVADHAGLFQPFGLRARAARAWLHHPRLPAPAGVLIFENEPRRTGLPTTRRTGGTAGGQR